MPLEHMKKVTVHATALAHAEPPPAVQSPGFAASETPASATGGAVASTGTGAAGGGEAAVAPAPVTAPQATDPRLGGLTAPGTTQSFSAGDGRPRSAAAPMRQVQSYQQFPGYYGAYGSPYAMYQQQMMAQQQMAFAQQQGGVPRQPMMYGYAPQQQAYMMPGGGYIMMAPSMVMQQQQQSPQ